MLRYRKYMKYVSVFLALNMLYEIFYPITAFALTGGPSQPEIQGFTPIGTTDMVDLSTGAFNYNIPLLDVDGYPINIAYHSGITMDQEASWVGLGWNINPGVVQRNLRGIPDDFNGEEQIKKTYNIKQDNTYGINGDVGLKIVGIPINLGISFGIFNNTYKGFGTSFGISPSISAGIASKGALTAGLGLSLNSQDGADVSPTIGLSGSVNDGKSGCETSIGINVGCPFNSRSGLKGLNMSASLSQEKPVTSEYTKSDHTIGKSTDDAGGGMTNSTFISFASPTYTPTITMPMTNHSFTFHATLGLAMEGLHVNFTLTGYGSNQRLTNSVISKPAYGYLYSDIGERDPNGLLDFNREKDVPFKPSTKNIAVPIFTYDLFSASGQGTGGQYRAYRGDVGELFDHIAQNTNTSNSLGIEVGAVPTWHVGIDFNNTNVNTTTQQWNSDNSIAPYIQFKGLDGKTLYEPYYFKNVGEKTINDTSYYSTIKDTKPVSILLTGNGRDEVANNNFLSYSQDASTYLGTDGIYASLKKSRREKRNQSFSFMTGAEAQTFGLDKNILSYPLDTNVFSNCSYSNRIKQYNRTANSNQMHQMSEITVLNSDGKRYIYGIPAYNTYQKEVTFSVVHGYGDTVKQLVKYIPGSDNSVGNKRGLSNYYDGEETPQYAHSFLLTGVLSPDYVDMTGDGISDDDLGQAVKINYTMADSDYQWRIPYNKDTASYEQGFINDTTDDKGSYIYGKKQVWYVHSIESKTMVAQFYLSKRNDGYGVQDENGGFDSTLSRPLLKLDSIALFSKADLLQHGMNALPIKVVHFVYDYSLCNKIDNFNPNIVSSTRGKLTLKSIYFTYERNTEGKLNSYQFNYCCDNVATTCHNRAYNPFYNSKKYDRWGNYDSSSAGMPLPADFPYTVQNKSLADTFARAWTLSNIILPSGGQINVCYEANDYAYVQNQRAQQMCLVQGTFPSLSDTTSDNTLYSGNILKASTDNYYLRLKIPIAAYGRQDFYNKYLSGIDTADQNATKNKLYFKFKVDIDGKGHYEYVPGYADISDWGVFPNHTTAWIELKPDPDDGMNPIAKATWQFARLNLPQFAYPYSVDNNSGVGAFLFSLLGMISSLGELFISYSQHAINHNYGNKFVPSHSWIRLDNPSYRKFGGGARVKQISISDNWSEMENGYYSASYGQNYYYTTTLDNSNQVISSGVATWEPSIGGDENPFREPLPYTEEEKLAPNNQLYTEYPLGESLYPGPEIIYSRVTVQNIQHEHIQRTSTGYNVNTFYTAKDFPTLNYFTPLLKSEAKSKMIFQLIGMHIFDYVTAAQGFVVEVNDMPGKASGQYVYNADSSLLSSTTYSYQTDLSNPNHLSNNVKVVEPSGKIDSASVGKDIDMWVDMRQQETDNHGITLSPTTDGIGFGILSFPLLSFFPQFSSETTRFRSAAVVKYIHRTGILASVTKMENGSTVTTQNLLYNGETGEVLLTKTSNEYDAPIYNFTYPALWAYTGMAPACSNLDAQIAATLHKGIIKYPANAKSIFTPGDEVEILPNDTCIAPIKKYWIIEPQDSLVVIDTSGKVVTSGVSLRAFTGNCYLKVMRSGHRNMGDEAIGSVVSMQCPISGDSVKLSSSNKIIQANATLFSDQWKTVCKENYYDCEDSPIIYTPLSKNYIRNLSIFDCFNYALHGQGYGNNSISAGVLFDDFAQYGYSVKLPFGQSDTVTYRPVDCDINSNNNYLGPYYKAVFGDCSYTIQSTKNKKIPWPFYTIPGTIKKGPKGLTCYLGRDTCNRSKYNPVYSMANPPVWIPLPGEGYFWYYPDTTCAHWDTLAVATLNCTKCSILPLCRQFVTGDTINPYANGMLGNWRQYKGYVYYGDRYATASADTSTVTNISKDGNFNTFNPFWKYSSSVNSFTVDTLTDPNWVWNNSVTLYNSKGSEIENKDALGRYSSALYGYIDALPTAVASNTKYKDLAFDNFEDYGFESSCNNPCMGDHFNFIDTISTNSSNTKADTTSICAHSGRYSLRILPNGSANVTRTINYYPDSLFLTDSSNYVLKNGGCIYKFSPDSGDYILSAWVKEGNECSSSTYTHDSININFSGSSSSYSFKPSGYIIDGWQRYESKFHIPQSALAITVSLNTANDTAYFDDIRIYPFLGNMKSYVYDPVSLRLMAELDENNYATFYEYDDEGTLVRVKKETDEGIMTIKENRSTYHRK